MLYTNVSSKRLDSLPFRMRLLLSWKEFFRVDFKTLCSFLYRIILMVMITQLKPWSPIQCCITKSLDSNKSQWVHILLSRLHKKSHWTHMYSIESKLFLSNEQVQSELILTGFLYDTHTRELMQSNMRINNHVWCSKDGVNCEIKWLQKQLIHDELQQLQRNNDYTTENINRGMFWKKTNLIWYDMPLRIKVC